jgi:CheY-like chemotaxis protein
MPVFSNRALIIDDDEASAKTLGWAMEFFGYHVELAADGPNAIAKARLFLPAVILVDIGLPGMNGYDVCKTLRKELAFHTATIIAQTGWDEPHHIEQGHEAGFTHYLVKPVDITLLQQLLKSRIAPAVIFPE